MTHAEAHESNSGLIWRVFIFLSIITVIEVFLGITKPDILHKGSVLGTSILNWIFLFLTLVKAYGIAWYFMHLRDEKASLRRVIVWTVVFLISYLSFILLVEGDDLGRIVLEYSRWNY